MTYYSNNMSIEENKLKFFMPSNPPGCFDNKLKYCRLNKADAIEKCKEIENNPNLTIQQKVDEFNLIGYGQVYDSFNCSYTLESDYIGIKKWFELVSLHIFYKPIDENLPTISLIRRETIY